MRHFPISLEGYEACLRWLTLARDGREADPTLLTRSLPQGNVREAIVQPDPADGSPMIAALILGGTHHRHFDPAGILASRLVLLPGGSVRVLHNVVGRLHYVQFLDDISALRLLADAQPGEVIEQCKDSHGRVLDHFSLRLRNFVRITAEDLRAGGKATGVPYKGRDAAIRIARENFKKALREGRLGHLPIDDPDQYERLLREAFDILDKQHGCEVAVRSSRADAAE